MQQVLYLAAALLCPLGMAALMWIMMRGGSVNPPEQSDTAAQQSELERLRDEVDRRRAHQRDELSPGPTPVGPFGSRRGGVGERPGPARGAPSRTAGASSALTLPAGGCRHRWVRR